MCGIFPPVDSPDGAKEETTPLEELFQAGCANYKSLDELFEDAEIEVSRLEELRYCAKVTKEQAKEWWDEGTIAKMAIIVKENQGGTRKRRIIIAERRSGLNDSSRFPNTSSTLGRRHRRARSLAVRRG